MSKCDGCCYLKGKNEEIGIGYCMKTDEIIFVDQKNTCPERADSTGVIYERWITFDEKGDKLWKTSGRKSFCVYSMEPEICQDGFYADLGLVRRTAGQKCCDYQKNFSGDIDDGVICGLFPEIEELSETNDYYHVIIEKMKG